MRQPLRFSLILLLAGLVLSARSHAQVGVFVGATGFGTGTTRLSAADREYSRKGPGRYQLMGAGWQSGKLLLTSTQLTVSGSGRQKLGLENVRQVVLDADTFAVVRNVKFPDASFLSVTPALGRRVWRHPQVELFEYRSAAGILPLLRFPNGKALVLPVRSDQFRAAMLLLVGDHPQLADQLRTSDLEAAHTRFILATYLQWKPTGFDPAALLAATPAAQ